MVHQDRIENSSLENYAVASLRGDRISLDEGEPESLFGAWHGPIEFPDGDQDNLITEAEFEIIEEELSN